MKRTRPTLRCLRDDLKLPPGTADHPLDEIDHPLLTKANDQFGESSTPRERIAAIDDQVLFKVAVRIIGSVPEALTATVLALVPGCDADGWFPEYALPERSLGAAEQAWYNIMDPAEAAKLLDG